MRHKNECSTHLEVNFVVATTCSFYKFGNLDTGFGLGSIRKLKDVGVSYCYVLCVCTTGVVKARNTIRYVLPRAAFDSVAIRRLYLQERLAAVVGTLPTLASDVLEY